MSNTYCSKCIFSDVIASNKPCEFDIPKLLKDIKQISDVDNYYVINNYQCLYGFGKNQYQLNEKELINTDIKTEVSKKASLKYYFLIDARYISDEQIIDLIQSINKLTIKPQKLSIMINPNRSNDIYQYIQKHIECPKWSVHVFLESLSLNDCINIVLDTNLTSSNSWCVIFYDGARQTGNDNKNLDLKNIITYLHNKIIIQQITNLGFAYDQQDLHGVCLNSGFYKYLTSNVSNNILDAIKTQTDFVLQTYEETY